MEDLQKILAADMEKETQKNNQTGDSNAGPPFVGAAQETG